MSECKYLKGAPKYSRIKVIYTFAKIFQKAPKINKKYLFWPQCLPHPRLFHSKPHYYMNDISLQVTAPISSKSIFLLLVKSNESNEPFQNFPTVSAVRAHRQTKNCPRSLKKKAKRTSQHQSPARHPRKEPISAARRPRA